MNKIALIVGGSGGLGSYAANWLFRDGWDVIITTRNLKTKNPKYRYIESKLDSAADLEHLCSELDELTHGRGVDALIYAAGPFNWDERKSFVDHSEQEISELMIGNLLSPLWLIHRLLPQMRLNKFGRVIFFGFGQVDELPSWPYRAVYAAAKTALASFTKSLSKEEAEHGITVNMVAPGDIRGVHKSFSIDDIKHVQEHRAPVGRPGTGEDIARVLEFLLHPDSSFITGAIFNITGGLRYL